MIWKHLSVHSNLNGVVMVSGLDWLLLRGLAAFAAT